MQFPNQIDVEIENQFESRRGSFQNQTDVEIELSDSFSFTPLLLHSFTPSLSLSLLLLGRVPGGVVRVGFLLLGA